MAYDTAEDSPGPVRVLFVEDDPEDARFVTTALATLALERGSLRTELVRVERVAEALERLAAEHFDAVLLDLRLPDASGLQGVERLRAALRSVALIVLTGTADRELAQNAIKRGAQDYLVKGELTPSMLDRALRYSLERARLAQSERELLEETLQGSINALAGILALANPAAVGRAMRLKQYVSDVAARLGLEDRWSLEVAALVSQIGCVTLHAETSSKLYGTETLSAVERQAVERMPEIAADLLANIPRLEPVRAILLHQRAGGSGAQEGAQPPRAALLLRLAGEYDLLETRLGSAHAALRALEGRRGRYDPALFDAFVELRNAAVGREEEQRSVPELMAGMVLARDVVTSKGRLLIARGHEITDVLLARLHEYYADGELDAPIHVTEIPPRQGSRDFVTKSVGESHGPKPTRR